ncbi:MAG: hypothetical protein BWX96_03160 [Bacteroidetes bacterium ADurb.Bin145]|nr:MAG: hypothetical protein BWX96_03160 [Bacteroidetes bacterium ADurb.Bin145]
MTIIDNSDQTAATSICLNFSFRETLRNIISGSIGISFELSDQSARACVIVSRLNISNSRTKTDEYGIRFTFALNISNQSADISRTFYICDCIILQPDMAIGDFYGIRNIFTGNITDQSADIFIAGNNRIVI